MPSSLNGTGVTFNDGTTQESASNLITRTYTSPATWTKPAGLRAIKVTVVGGGGNGGGTAVTPKSQTRFGGGGGGGGTAIRWIPAPTIPGPVAVTRGAAGGTSSFGTFASATGGATGTVSNAYSRVGGGSATAPGGLAVPGSFCPATPFSQSYPDGGGAGTLVSGDGGAAHLGVGGGGRSGTGAGNSGGGLGGGGGGAAKTTAPAQTGGAGAAGIVIIEEFY